MNPLNLQLRGLQQHPAGHQFDYSRRRQVATDRHRPHPAKHDEAQGQRQVDWSPRHDSRLPHQEDCEVQHPDERDHLRATTEGGAEEGGLRGREGGEVEQQGLNIELIGKFSQPYSLWGSFLTKTNGFLTRWKIT